ncbi:DUF1670 domain-containing protein, partial [bacterium]|nr:DUF1670 domain-containing protein [bacterium]
LQQFDEAEVNLLSALTLYGSLDEKRGQAEVLGMLGMLKMERGEPESAETDFLRAIEISTAIGYRHGEAVHTMNYGIFLTLVSRIADAVDRFETAAETYSEIGNERGQALVMSNAAWPRHAFLGEDEQSEAQIRFALEYYERIGDDRGRAQSLGVLASVIARTGDQRESDSLFRESLRIAEDAQDSWLAVQIMKEWAANEGSWNQLDSAILHAQHALERCEQMDIRDLAVSIEALLGRLLLKAGHFDDALAMTSKAMGSHRPGIEFGHLIPFSHALVLATHGDRAEADRYLSMAHEGLRDLLHGLDDERKQRAIQRVPLHQLVHEEWTRRQPTLVEVEIADLDAPSGRALRADEHTTVRWTVSAPDDETVEDAVKRRQMRIERLCTEAAEQHASPTVEDLAQTLGASVATIRRDLAALREQGRTVNTRGSRVA